MNQALSPQYPEDQAIPSITRCLQLMEQYAMLPNIVAHSQMVARVAETIYTKLSAHLSLPHLPALNLLIAGGLLHDIAKTPCLGTSKSHAQEGAALCIAHGFPQIAAIVAEHVLIKDFDPARYRRGLFFATELIYYADKRVMHDKIVDLDERLAYILERYAANNSAKQAGIRENFVNCAHLEKAICLHAGTDAQHLLDSTCHAYFS